MKRLAGCPTVLSVLTDLRIAGTAVGLAALAVFALSCSGGSGGDGGPEGVARKAAQALIGGNETAYLEEVRPDGRGFVGITAEDLRGCELAQILVGDPSQTQEVEASIVFKSPCGALRLKSCQTTMVLLSGRWYLDHRFADCLPG